MATIDATRGERAFPAASDLAWEPSQAGVAWLEIRAAYVRRLADGLGAVLARTGTTSASSEQLLASLELLSQEDLERFLSTPRVSYQVLWASRNCSPDETVSELSSLARLELSRLGLTRTRDTGWVALGDCTITEGARECQPSVPGLPAIDLLSPHARSIDLAGQTWTVDTSRRELPASVQHELRQQLETAARVISLASADVLRFVNLFTCVLVAQLDQDNPGFASGTCWQYLGQSALSNFRPGEVSGELLADAIVHESTHGYLYMLEHEAAWVLDPKLYSPTPLIRSPWSQRLLPVRPYLQACFVWFGLVNFWHKALTAGASGPEAERLFRRSRTGFLSDSLRERLGEYEPRIANPILDAIDAMQEVASRT